MDKYLIVKYQNVFNVISDIFKSLHRIKILDFDISHTYIVFSASSGGLFVFKHLPCNLIKFIPSMEGSTLLVKISSDEHHLALANSKGLVVILENFFMDFTIRPLVLNDHEGNLVTTLKWHGNELYSGDNSGKVSVFTLAKNLFQSPSAVLLILDSTIVQLDNYQNYFIVSTKSWNYLCDGEKGQYKQIGKKVGKGERGACFSKNSFDDPSVLHPTSVREIFTMTKDQQAFEFPEVSINSKIYCARPKGRLWEANFETSIVKTYDFRNIPQNNEDVLIIENSEDVKLTINKCDSKTECVNFKKLYTICDRFILTYTSNSIHIVDPSKGTLVFSKNDFENIIRLRVLNNSIFIWTDDFKMNVLTLQNLEEFIVSTLLKKQYILCSDICIHFKNYLVDFIKTSARLRLLAILKSKLAGNEKLLKELDPIFSSLESAYRNDSTNKITEKGIVTVENGYVNIEEENSFLLANIPENGNNVKKKDDEDFENNKIYCIYRQYNLNKVELNVELNEYQNLLNNMSIDDILVLMEDFQKIIQDIDTDNKQWIQMQLIKTASRKLNEITTLLPKTLTFLTDAFLQIHSSDDLHCKCLFPLPKAHCQKLKDIELGIQLYSLLNNKKYYLNNIPYLYGQYLKEKTDLDFTSLCLLVQFSDVSLLKEMGKNLTYDTWEEIVKLFIQLRKGRCLNCSENIEVDSTWSWTDLGIVLVKFIGSMNSIRLLKRYSADINNGQLTSIFFNSCIMARAYEEYPIIIDVIDEQFSQYTKFNSVMEEYLEKQYLNKEAKLEVQESQKCSYCALPLNGPILNQYKKCNCGNKMHYLCFISNDKICNRCLP